MLNNKQCVQNNNKRFAERESLQYADVFRGILQFPAVCSPEENQDLSD